MDDAFAYRRRDLRLEEKESEKVEKRRPSDRLQRSQYTGRHDGCDGVRGIVEAVHEIEQQRHEDQDDENFERHVLLSRARRRGAQEFSRTMPCMTLATSSQRSVTLSSISYTERIF